MALIVDGYNVLFAIAHYGRGPVADAVEEARGRLLRRLVRQHQETGETSTVVFDSRQQSGGAMREESLPGVRVLYSHPPRTADDDIRRLVEASTAPQSLRVVTSDRELAAACARCGAEVVGARTFFRRLSAGIRRADAEQREHQIKREPPSDDEIREWLEIFGSDEPPDDP